MKNLKCFVAVALICVMLVSLCSCGGISKKDAIGTWSGAYVYNGSQFVTAFALSENGTYAEITYKDGSMANAETGTWEVDDGEVVLYENGNKNYDIGVTSTRYQYKSGVLVNSGHEFRKD